MEKLEKNNLGRSGFTLIEILVASLLLGMLMTILTMVFNSSAIAWRTGRASNSMMSKARRQLAYVQHMADNVLPRVDTIDKTKSGRVLSAWGGSSDNSSNRKTGLRDRAVLAYGKGDFPFNLPDWDMRDSSGTSVPRPWQEVTGIQSLRTSGGQTYLVGVLSYGPDGKPGTEDDINTMPMLFE